MAQGALSRRLLTARRILLTNTRNIPKRTGTRNFSAAAASDPSNRVHIYISRSTDPYLNLSIEHFLLQKSHPDSVILLLYTNRPCIVIGRNQNPWTEVNLGLVNQRGILARLREENSAARSEKDGNRQPHITQGSGHSGTKTEDDVLLVRRRSGGGTVFHDAGNVNYSVICPPAIFDRDKHASMVVRALQSLNSELQARVSKRHDIVIDVAGNHEKAETETETFKISGSAYKLTSKRSLHHGTCLLSSPHLSFMGKLLRSPAAPYIKARGVESVRSPVRNVGIPNADFEDAVVTEFRNMYQNQSASESEVEVEIVNAADVEGITEIQSGVAELRSKEWIYAQTPQFDFSTHATPADPRPRPEPPSESNLPGLQMTVRHAKITRVGTSPGDKGQPCEDALTRLDLHHINDWRDHFGSANKGMGQWLNGLFGVNVR
ncbi:hypothetical protein F5Y16DRAFT_165123 [Xylariaceae sp. FL0255]|nr:hypothetical protein F5Y16DRAFT_165123 [Xylariaceae sp. FL0255]